MSLQQCYKKAGLMREIGFSKEVVGNKLQRCISEVVGGVAGVAVGEGIGGEGVVSGIVSSGVKKVLEVGVGQIGSGGGVSIDDSEGSGDSFDGSGGGGGLVSVATIGGTGGGVGVATFGGSGGGAGVAVSYTGRLIFNFFYKQVILVKC